MFTITKTSEGTVKETQLPNISYFSPARAKAALEQMPQNLLPASLSEKQDGVHLKSTITVVMEKDLLAEKIITALDENKVHYYADSNNELVRFIFRGNLDISCCSVKIMCGASVQMYAGTADCLENSGDIQVIHSDEEFSPLPFWMNPVADASPLNSNTLLTGESQWTNYMKPIYQWLKASGMGHDKAAHAAVMQTAHILNKYFRKYPFNEKKMANFLDVQDLEFDMRDYFETVDNNGHAKKIFRKDAFCEYFILRYKLINVEYLPRRYIDGVYYLAIADDVERLLMRYLENSTAAIRKDVRQTIFALLGVYNEETLAIPDGEFEVISPAPPELIAFQNGIYNIKTGEMLDFDENIIITNRIPYDLKLGYYDELTANGEQTEEMKTINDWLDSFSEYNHEKRLVLEESAGLPLYLRNAGLRRQHTILVGTRESGKSTFIRMVEHLLGNPANCSHVSLEEICNNYNRFSMVSMIGTAANTYGDISSKTIMDASRLKNLCTGEGIGVEEKGQPRKVMAYRGKLLFGCNELPRIDDTAISSRFEFIPCNADYDCMGPANIPNMFEDHLSKIECMEYFAYLAVKALQRFINNGFKHTYCEENEKLRQIYERVSNPVRAFVNAVQEEEIVNQKTTDVFAKFTAYLKEVLHFSPKEIAEMTQHKFTSSMKRLGYDTKKVSVNNHKYSIYIKKA